jgi:hypothetical protein
MVETVLVKVIAGFQDIRYCLKIFIVIGQHYWIIFIIAVKFEWVISITSVNMTFTTDPNFLYMVITEAFLRAVAVGMVQCVTALTYHNFLMTPNLFVAARTLFPDTIYTT